MIIATSGHVDHGKSLLVQNLTGIDPDRLTAEKERGLTIDLGFAYCENPQGTRIGFIDVPGHIRFINNMLAGVSTIDLGLLVIAADDGPMPQTLEHLAILNLLGIERGAIVLTKIDRVDEARINEVLGLFEALIEKFGANTCFRNSPVFALSNTEGTGILELSNWLFSQAAQLETRAEEGNFRLAIDRSFSVKGAGIVVTGSVFSGQVKTGDELTLVPAGTPVRVRGIHRQNLQGEKAVAGDRAALNITATGLELEQISRGNWLISGEVPKTSERVDARIQVLASESRPVTTGTMVHLHSAANHVQARLAVLEGRSIAPGESGLVQLSNNRPINLWFGDRIIIRDTSASRTLGGGLVIDPHSPARGRARVERTSFLHLNEIQNNQQALSALVDAQRDGVDLDRFALDRNLDQDQQAGLLKHIDLIKLSDNRAWSKPHWASLKEHVENEIKTHLQLEPQSTGLPLKSLLGAIKPKLSVTAMARILEELQHSGKIEIKGGRARPKGAGIKLEGASAALWEKVKTRMSVDKLRPPVLHELAKDLDMAPKQLEKQLSVLVGTGQLVRPVANRFYLPEAVEELAQLLRTLAARKPMFSAADYRDISGLGRNLAISILEYFDKTGLTQRVGDLRQLRQ